ncbi:hypothetical protein NEDG_00901 [Nematocida displodere]|uniref:Uncharacterized protein n=1 Tax=Nematocida displodere TaxID=1805483 RepID=A0A177ED70_9MICR|nr:hypothetical protein NEDG_00901 [Nematocida displodere]
MGNRKTNSLISITENIVLKHRNTLVIVFISLLAYGLGVSAGSTQEASTGGGNTSIPNSFKDAILFIVGALSRGMFVFIETLYNFGSMAQSGPVMSALILASYVMGYYNTVKEDLPNLYNDAKRFLGIRVKQPTKQEIDAEKKKQAEHDAASEPEQKLEKIATHSTTVMKGVSSLIMGIVAIAICMRGLAIFGAVGFSVLKWGGVVSSFSDASGVALGTPGQYAVWEFVGRLFTNVWVVAAVMVLGILSKTIKAYLMEMKDEKTELDAANRNIIAELVFKMLIFGLAIYFKKLTLFGMADVFISTFRTYAIPPIYTYLTGKAFKKENQAKLPISLQSQKTIRVFVILCGFIFSVTLLTYIGKAFVSQGLYEMLYMKPSLALPSGVIGDVGGMISS